MTVESSIEKHLGKVVAAHGGEVRKVKWVGRRHAPDRLCIFEDPQGVAGFHFFVELKRPGERLRPGQAREWKRLTQSGMLIIPPISEKKNIDDLFALLNAHGRFDFMKDNIANAKAQAKEILGDEEFDRLQKEADEAMAMEEAAND